MKESSHILALLAVVAIIFIAKLLIRWRTGQYSIRAAYKNWVLIRRYRAAFREYKQLRERLSKIEANEANFWMLGDAIITYQNDYKDIDIASEYAAELWSAYEEFADNNVFIGI